MNASEPEAPSAPGASVMSLVQALPDSTAGRTETLQEVEVTAKGAGSGVKRFSDGNVRVDAAKTATGIRTLGEADMIAALRMLPGVESGSDYASGLQVDGGTASQVLMTVDGSPLTFPYRFGGIFSTFNTPHFRHSDFSRSFGKPELPQRLGAATDFIPLRPEEPVAKLSAGILASSLTTGISSGKFDFLVSGRISYLNKTVGPFVNNGDTKIDYDFKDLNFNAAYNPSPSHRISLGAMLTDDRLKYADVNYAVTTRIKWSNALCYLGWEGEFLENREAGAITASARLYHTRFKNILEMNIPEFDFKAPSTLETTGGHFRVTVPLTETKALALTGGTGLESHRINPMDSEAHGLVNFESPGKGAAYGTPLEGRVFATLSAQPASFLKMEVSGVFTAYHNGKNYSRSDISPRIKASFSVHEDHVMTLKGGKTVQYLHQTGFSDIGLASNFWLPASERLPGQYAWNFSLGYTTPVLFNHLRGSVEGYWNLVYHQTEFEGRLLDITTENYSPLSGTIVTKGFNRGVNILAEGFGERWGATVSLGFGEGKRHCFKGEEYWRAQTDPGISLTAAGNYRLNRNLSITAIFRYSSGRPYTPVKRLYLIGGNLMKQSGKRNSRRMNDYQRLDLGLTWEFDKGIFHHDFNFSILNAYGHRNVEMQSFVIDTQNLTFKEKDYSSLYRFIPSVSYTVSLKVKKRKKSNNEM